MGFRRKLLGILLRRKRKVLTPMQIIALAFAGIILLGSLLLVLADTLSRSLGSGSALPVGAITSLLGAPFFIAIIFSRKENHGC